MTDKLDLIIEKINDLKDSHGKRLDKIDDNLEDHMLRCDLLEQQIKTEEKERLEKEKEIVNRVDKLELPGKVLKFIKQSALWLAAMAGVILTVAKLIELWSK